MTTERDPNLLIAAWLEEGPRDLPSDTRRAIETAVRTMPQRRLGLGRSWRFPTVNGYLRPTLLVAAILISVVGVAVYGRLRPIDSVGGPGTSPSASASGPAPSPAPTASPVAPTGRIAYLKTDAQYGMYGNFLGIYTSNADGTGPQKLDIATHSDGAVWSPDGSKLLLVNTEPTGGLGYRPAIVNPGGSGYQRLQAAGVPASAQMACAAWSPDGSKILCGWASDTDPGGIVTLDVATGNVVAHISSGAFPGVKGTKNECGGGDSSGAWSPDGSKVVFVRHHCGSKPDPVKNEAAAIYIANADGSGTPQEIVAMGQINSSEPQVSWSPDGQWLLFSNGGLFIAHPDGTAYRTILADVSMGSYIYSPVWSPDGARIAFSAWHEGDTADLYTTLADGTDIRRLTHDAASEDNVSWTR